MTTQGGNTFYTYQNFNPLSVQWTVIHVHVIASVDVAGWKRWIWELVEKNAYEYMYKITAVATETEFDQLLPWLILCSS